MCVFVYLNIDVVDTEPRDYRNSITCVSLCMRVYVCVCMRVYACVCVYMCECVRVVSNRTRWKPEIIIEHYYHYYHYYYYYYYYYYYEFPKRINE